MKLVHAEVVLDFLGNPVQWGPQPMTMRDIATMALTAPEPPGAQPQGAEGKARAFALAQKLYRRSRTVEMSEDERVFLRSRAGLTLDSPVLYGRLCDWLEGKSQTVATEEDEEEDDAPTG